MAAVGKVSFAEQLSIRCKPYFDALLNSGIEKFDEYVKALNDKDSSGLYKQFSASLEAHDEKVNDNVDGIRKMIRDYIASDIQEMKEMLENGNSPEVSDVADVREDVEADENKLEDPPSSGKVSVLNLVAKLQNEFQEYVNKQDEKEKEAEEEEEEFEDKSKKEKKENDKERAAAKSQAMRTSKSVQDIKEKVHENKFKRFIKFIAKVAGFAVIWHYLKEPIKNFLKSIGIDLDAWGPWFQKNFPKTYEVVTKVKNFFDKEWDWICKLFQDVKDWLDRRKEKKRKEEIRQSKGTNTAAVYATPGAMVAMNADVTAGREPSAASMNAPAGTSYSPSHAMSMPEGVAVPEDLNVDADYVASTTSSIPSFTTPSVPMTKSVLDASTVAPASPSHIQQLLSEGKIEVDKEQTAAFRESNASTAQGLTQGSDDVVYKWTDSASQSSPSQTRGVEAPRPNYVVTQNMAQVVYNIQGESSFVQ